MFLNFFLKTLLRICPFVIPIKQSALTSWIACKNFSTPMPGSIKTGMAPILNSANVIALKSRFGLTNKSDYGFYIDIT